MTTSSRETVLRKLRAALPQSAPLPDLPDTGPWMTFDDPLSRFQELISVVGGRLVQTTSVAEADQQLREIEAWSAARVRCSLVPGIGESTFDPDAVKDPHQLEDVDYAVLPGVFGVAENGAIWVTDRTVAHRVLYFLPQHLSIVIPTSQIVHNMHEAYARIEPQQYAFSGFISGPSKTADIEQSLVIGAHGARSLTVFAVDEL